MTRPMQLALGPDERQLLDLALDHDPLGFARVGGARVRHQTVGRRHAVGDAPVAAVDEPHVPLGEQALQPPPLVDDDQGADTRPRHHRPRLVDRRRRRDAVRIVDDAVLRALHDLDFANLRLDLARAEPAIDDADAPFFGLDDRHRRARHGIHVGRDDRPLQGDPARQLARQVDDGRVAPLQDAALRREDEVVEGAAEDAGKDRPADKVGDLGKGRHRGHGSTCG